MWMNPTCLVACYNSLRCARVSTVPEIKCTQPNQSNASDIDQMESFWTLDLLRLGRIVLKGLGVQVLDADESKGINSKEFRMGLRKLVSLLHLPNGWSTHFRSPHLCVICRISIHQSTCRTRILLSSPTTEICLIRMDRFPT